MVALPRIEWGRRFRGPALLVNRVREYGASAPARDPARRARLRRAIAAVDARLPGGPNCLRRALLEMRLDAGAARELIHFGLRAHGGPRSGHAWLSSWPDSERASSYDAVLEM